MKKFLFGALVGITGTRAVISVFDFFAQLHESQTFIEVMEAASYSMLWIAAAVISTAILIRELAIQLKESNDAINATREELTRKGK